MEYISTRGAAPSASFRDALTAGLAPDGGLYVPAHWPTAPAEISADVPYADSAAAVMSAFTGDFLSTDRLRAICHKVYDGFDHPDTAPLIRVGEDDYILELFHGPTLAFKDFAMQLLGAFFDEALAQTGEQLTIIAATSGDTGAAAIHALCNCDRVNVVVLHPEGRVTEVQRRMMTCVDNDTVLNIAVDGSFDDCQTMVKALFADRAFADSVGLSGVNSINWGRLAAQTVYYFTAAAKIGADRPTNFIVPTGNFGDVFAGYAAKKMGLSVGRLGVATNQNDILDRALKTGRYEPAGVHATLSPSMDIQIASNFERLLFDAMGRDAEETASLMTAFQKAREIDIPESALAAMREDFISYAADDKATQEEIRSHYQKTETLIDPHTAVARCAARAFREGGEIEGPVVTLSTAHPAKFPDAVEAATTVHPDLPPRWADLFDRREQMVRARADTCFVASMISERFNRL